MTEREKMLAGQLYDCGNPELLNRWHLAKNLMRDYNLTDSDDMTRKEEILNQLLGGRGKNLWITAPFYVDYGNNIYFGNNCEINMNCTFLDDNKIVIGDNALIAPPMCRSTPPSIPPMPLTGSARPEKTAPSNSARPRLRLSSSATMSGSAAVPLSCPASPSAITWSSAPAAW